MRRALRRRQAEEIGRGLHEARPSERRVLTAFGGRRRLLGAVGGAVLVEGTGLGRVGRAVDGLRRRRLRVVDLRQRRACRRRRLVDRRVGHVDVDVDAVGLGLRGAHLSATLTLSGESPPRDAIFVSFVDPLFMGLFQAIDLWPNRRYRQRRKTLIVQLTATASFESLGSTWSRMHAASGL